MENKTKNTVLVICASLITLCICLVVIAYFADRYQVNKFVNELTNSKKQFNVDFEIPKGQILLSTSFVTNLQKKVKKLESENKRLKKRFATQIDAERNKSNIKWSDGSKKPKYNQVQEDIGN